MTLIDDIKRDQRQGTSGAWSICEYDAGDVDHWSGMPSVQAEDKYDCAIVHWDGFVQRFWRSANGDCQIHANARRIARVPAMEEALLAAVELADGFELLVQDLMNDEEADADNLADALCKLVDLRAALEAGQ